MSQAAHYADKAMLDVQNLGHDTWQTVHFQRATVVGTELVLVYALYLYVGRFSTSRGDKPNVQCDRPDSFSPLHRQPRNNRTQLHYRYCSRQDFL
jgi:hypothetical protein